MIRAACAAAVLLVAAPAADGALRFEREDGTVLRAPGTPRVWCAPWAPDVAEPALHIAVRPRRGGFWWHLAAVRRDLLRGQAFTFPHSFVYDRPSGALLFAVDGRNELSSSEEESRGRLFYPRISCRPGRVVTFRIDATLGSELHDLETISVSGRFRGRVAARGWPAPVGG